MTTYASFWNKLAERYAKQPVANPEAFERKIAINRALMGGDDVVLGVGCGTGSLALRLAPSAGHVHGLDVSSEMIRIARSKADEQGVGNVTFHVGSFDESFTALQPGSLDGVCAYSILHLVDDRPEALARIHDLLKPGGWFVSSTVCLGDTWVPYMPIIAVMRLIGKAPRVANLSCEGLMGEIRDAGFVDLENPDVGAQPTVGFVVARKPR
jgi:arsenite methyltransferase